MTFRIDRNVYFVHVLLFSILLCLFIIHGFKNSHNWCNDLKHLYPLPVSLESLRSTLHGNSKLVSAQRINANNFYGTVFNPSHICTSEKLEILSVVKSSPENFGRRLAIRESWGKLASKGSNQLIFSLGSTNLISLQNTIKKESDQYQDILQFKFEDSYRNLTVKLINNIRWISKICSHAKFIAFIDDDVAINYRNLKTFTSKISLKENDSLYTGYVVSGYGTGPYRMDSKHAISLDEYLFPCFPSYVSGAITLTSGKTVKLFDAAIPYVKPFFIDDVYLGIVALKLGIPLSPDSNHLFDHDGSRLHEFSSLISSNQGPHFFWKIYELTM